MPDALTVQCPSAFGFLWPLIGSGGGDFASGGAGASKEKISLLLGSAPLIPQPRKISRGLMELLLVAKDRHLKGALPAIRGHLQKSAQGGVCQPA